MAKNKKTEPSENELQEQMLTPEIVKAIEDIINQKEIIAMKNEDVKESIKAVAAKLGIKPKSLSSRINLIIKEEKEGGEVKQQNNDIEFVHKYIEMKNGEE